MALILVYLSAGPITNITENLKESVRVILCQVFMTFSLTKTKYELMFKPLGEAFVKLRVSCTRTPEITFSTSLKAINLDVAVVKWALTVTTTRRKWNKLYANVGHADISWWMIRPLFKLAGRFFFRTKTNKASKFYRKSTFYNDSFNLSTRYENDEKLEYELRWGWKFCHYRKPSLLVKCATVIWNNPTSAEVGRGVNF